MKRSRRSFLGHTCGWTLAASTLTGTALQLGVAGNVAAAGSGADDYRALVCILLAGGNDAFNLLVPADADQHAAYARIRSDLALPLADLLPLSGTDANGHRFGVHPGVDGIRALYDDGDLAFVANVGTLAERVDAAAIDNGAPLPLGLFSHADQIQQWQTAVPDARIADGWGGRVADLLASGNGGGAFASSVSLSGSNTFQSGRRTVEYSISNRDDGAPGIEAYGRDDEFGRFRTSSIDALLGVSYASIMRSGYQRRLRRAVDSQRVFVDALRARQPLQTTFSAGPFSQNLAQVARVIAAREQLGMRRQTFYIVFGGWDHHDDVLEKQASMLPAVSAGLVEFRAALQELGVFDAVTTFTISDFARTLTSNGKGSDHGWGGHHLVMGGSVAGGRVLGSYPPDLDTSPLDVGRGVLIPTLSADEYFADLALWFGVSAADLDTVLPNVRRFYSPGSAVPPLGLFAPA